MYREIKFNGPVENLNIEDYVVVKIVANKKEFYYIGQILSFSKKECEIYFLRKSKKVSNKFFFPDIKNVAVAKNSDIVLRLSKPHLAGIKRQQNVSTFWC